MEIRPEALRPAPLSSMPASSARPSVPASRPITPAQHASIHSDAHNVRSEGLRGAAARALAAQPASPIELSPRTLPADPPTPRENFKQGASEVLLCLDKLCAYFDPIAALQPASQPLYLRIQGLIAAVGDRLFDAADRSALSQEQLLGLLVAVDEVRGSIADDQFRPDPATPEGGAAIDALLARLEAVLPLPHGPAMPPSATDNFRQAAMEQTALLNKLLALFDPIAQLEPDSQDLYRQLLGLAEALTRNVNDLRHPVGMRQEDLLQVLRDARSLRQALDSLGGGLPSPTTAEGRRQIEGFFQHLKPFVPYQPAPAPTPRQNFKQAASEALLCLNQASACFDPIAQLEPASQPLFLRLGGLMEVVGDRLYRYEDTSAMGPEQLLRVLKAAEAMHEAAARRVDPATEEGRAELDRLYAELDLALALPHLDAKPPTLTANFKQAAMEEMAMLSKLLGFFDPMAQLDPVAGPLYRRLLGLSEALDAKLRDHRHPAGLAQNDLWQLLKDVRAVRQSFGQEGLQAPDPRTEVGRSRIEAYFQQIRPIVAYQPAKPPSARSNFVQGAMASLSVLHRLGSYFDDFARLEEPAQSLYLRLGGLIEALDARTLDFHDKTGLSQDQLSKVFMAVERVRGKLQDEGFKPDPKTAEGRRALDGLFSELDVALGLPHVPAKPSSQQDLYRLGGMEAMSVLNLLGSVFDDRSRLEPATQPLFLKLGGLVNGIGDRLYGHGRPGSLHPATMVALLRTVRAVRDTLEDPKRAPDPRTPEGRAKIDGFVTMLAQQLGMPFA